MKIKDLRLPVIVFILIAGFLLVINTQLDNPLILLERFFPGYGWIEILLLALFGAVVIHQMQDAAKVPQWRRITWLIFSFVFFGQLILGVSGVDGRFLMTGKLHLPVPAMIISGPLYRGQLSIMTILFLSTVILSGPAWCSQLCYFGALDNLVASGKRNARPLKYVWHVKGGILTVLILTTLILRWSGITNLWVTVAGGIFGIAGLVIIAFLSYRKGKMMHCIYYCPVGTLVNSLKYLNPFRMRIRENCTLCMKCTPNCNYDALNQSDIEKGRPGITCTYCGDCLSSCKENSIQYKFFNISPAKARNLYLIITITLYCVFMGLARI
jgi:ferredoxin-type protein NapH